MANHAMHDPGLTTLGEEQCARLRSSFPHHKKIELLVASPLRRAIQTATLSFAPEIGRGLTIITVPEAQEIGTWPADTGRDKDQLLADHAGEPVDFDLVVGGWNSNEGKWSADPEAIKARARAVRQFIRARPEKEVVLVTHGAFLHFLTQDWSDQHRFKGTGWANCEFRSFTFAGDLDDDASLVETEQSRRHRLPHALDETEKLQLLEAKEKAAERRAAKKERRAESVQKKVLKESHL